MPCLVWSIQTWSDRPKKMHMRPSASARIRTEERVLLDIVPHIFNTHTGRPGDRRRYAKVLTSYPAVVEKLLLEPRTPQKLFETKHNMFNNVQI